MAGSSVVVFPTAELLCCSTGDDEALPYQFVSHVQAVVACTVAWTYLSRNFSVRVVLMVVRGVGNCSGCISSRHM